jgi:hypothetical protein
VAPIPGLSVLRLREGVTDTAQEFLAVGMETVPEARFVYSQTLASLRTTVFNSDCRSLSLAARINRGESTLNRTENAGTEWSI